MGHMRYDFTSFTASVENTMQWLADEYMQLQTGKLSVAMLDKVILSVYGAKTPVPHCATIVLENPRTLLVSPYDATLLKEIEQAIREKFPSMNIVATDTGVRLIASEMLGERRTLLEKEAKEKAEMARQSVRGYREKVLADLKKKKADSELSEDEDMALKKELQNHVDEANKKIEDAKNTKLQDIQA